MFKHGVELSDCQDFLRSSRNLDWKIAHQRAKNTLVTSVRGTISLEPKLDCPQVQNFKEEGSASFPTTKNVENRRQQLGQPCAQTQTKSKENALKI